MTYMFKRLYSFLSYKLMTYYIIRLITAEEDIMVLPVKPEGSSG